MTAAVGPGSADELRTRSYVAGGERHAVVCPPPGGPDPGVGVGGVCFDLTGDEFQVDVHVLDEGQDRVGRADRTVERIAGPWVRGAVDAVKDAYAGTGGPASGTVNDSLDEATEDRTRFGFVGGVIRFEDAGGESLGDLTFCGGRTRMHLDSRAVRIKVLLDGALFGNALLSACGTTYAGATAGTVWLHVSQTA